MSPERHTGYYNLRDAFDSGICPLCNIIEKGIFKYFDDLLYEGVNTKEIADAMSKSKGLCNKHAQILSGFKDALGIAILYQRILEEINYTLSKKNAIHFYKEYKNFKEKQQKYCIGCLKEKEILDRYVDIFINFTDDFIHLLKQKGNPFCMEHFIYILEKFIDNQTTKIKEIKSIQKDNSEKLNKKLHVLVDSFNYTIKSRELDESDKNSWINAVEMISGKIFEKQRKWKR